MLEVLDLILKLRWYRDYIVLWLGRFFYCWGVDSLTFKYQFIKSKGISIQLDKEDWKQISSLETIKKQIQKPDIIAYDVYLSFQLIGFLMLRKYENDGYFLWDYAIDKNLQNQGHGTRILKQLFQYLKKELHAKEVSTTYLWENTIAKHVYEKVGFEETDVVFEEDVHEVNLVKKLEGEEIYD